MVQASPGERQGLDERFRGLFDHHGEEIYRFFVRRGLPAEAARDLTQDTFVRVYQELKGFRGDPTARTWVFSIAQSVFRNALRHDEASKRQADEVPLDPPGSTGEPDRPAPALVDAAAADPFETTLTGERRERRELDRAEPEAVAEATAAGWQRHRGTAWDELQRRIGGLEEDAGADRPVDAAPGAAPATDHPTARWWATAVLAAACLILAILLWQARTEVQPPRPVEVVYLSPSGSGLLRGGAPPDRRVVRPPQGHRVVVFLAYAGVDDGERFAAEIFPPTGEGPARIVEITRRSDQAFAVDLGTDPPPGQYRIVVHSVGVEGSRELATYGFRIGVPEPEAPPG